MIKQIKRLLEVGENALISDKYLYPKNGGEIVSGNVSSVRNIGPNSFPHFRETLVLELPPIPEGFRPVTEEDKKNKLSGELKFLFIKNSSTVSWEDSVNLNASNARDFLYIIKPKQKGFTSETARLFLWPEFNSNF